MLYPAHPILKNGKRVDKIVKTFLAKSLRGIIDSLYESIYLVVIATSCDTSGKSIKIAVLSKNFVVEYFR